MMSSRTSRPGSALKPSQPQFHTNLASSFPNMASYSNHRENVVPYTHPPLPKESSGLYDALITDSDMALSKKKFVKVTGIGEVEVQPDKIEFCIQITSNRMDIAQSKQSIKKREDYILSALKKYRIRDEDVIASTIIRKYDSKLGEEPEFQNNHKHEVLVMNELKNSPAVENQPTGKDKNDDNSKERLELIRELCINCDNLIKYLQVFSTCNEKLDRHVVVSQPVVRFSPEYIQIHTQNAVRLAMSNGTLKANEMLHPMKRRVALGRLYYSVEDSLTVEDVADYNKVLPPKFEIFSWKRLNKVIRCQLTSVFELEPVRERKMI